MVLWHTIELVGVGCPNPSGEETKPLRWMPCLDLFFPAPLQLCAKLSFHSCRLASIRGWLPFFTPHANMSPRWGFKTFGYPLVYKHTAPLGLNTSPLPTFPLSPLLPCGNNYNICQNTIDKRYILV